MAKITTLKVAPEPLLTRKETPVRAGSQMMSKYVFGHNPRKQQLTSETGVRGDPIFGTRMTNRRSMGLSHNTAPLKTSGMFDRQFSPGHASPGDTGATGES